MTLKEEHKIIAYSFLLGISVWFVDAVIETISNPEFTFMQALVTGISLAELSERLILIVVFVAFGSTIARVFTKRKTLEKEKEGLIRAVSDATNGIAIADASDRFIYVNEAYAGIFGMIPSSMLGQQCNNIISRDHAEQFERIHWALRNPSVGVFEGEVGIPRADGSVAPVELKAKAFWGEGEYQGFICVLNDISKRKEAEESLSGSIRFLNDIFDSIRDPFVILDRNLRIVRVNQAYCDVKGKKSDDLVGRECFMATRALGEPCDNCVVQKTFASGDPCAKEKTALLDDGSEIWLQILTYPISDESGHVTHVIEYVRNITDQKRVEQERERLIRNLAVFSSTDALTGLLNRRVLLDRLQAEIDRAQRYGTSFSILFCDLDYFKEVNDTLGHQAGDVVLREVAGIMKKAIRTCDVIGRYGGDEFIVILPETGLEGSQEVAERIRRGVQDSAMPFDRGSTRLSVSIGVTRHCPTDTAAEDLISRIDNALYLSKKAGKNQVYSIT